MFENEADAQRKIAKSLWIDADFFDSKISKGILDLTKFARTDDVTPDVLTTDLTRWTRRDKHCLWLALVYAYPDLNDNSLATLSGYFRLSIRDSVVLAAASGRETYLDRVLLEHRVSVLSLNLGDLGDAIKKATANGHTKLNQRLADFMNIISDNLTKTTGYLPDTYRFRMFQEPAQYDNTMHAADNDTDAALPYKRT